VRRDAAARSCAAICSQNQPGWAPSRSPATAFGAQVPTTTISRAQHGFAGSCGGSAVRIDRPGLPRASGATTRVRSRDRSKRWVAFSYATSPPKIDRLHRRAARSCRRSR
jgi:transposase